jgi:hypothetical protein
MHGVDWEAVWLRHAALLPQLGNRDDLDFLIGEMIGELNVSHAYVEPPASDRPERVPVGLLGCDLDVDRGRYRFARVFAGEPGNPARRAPLAAPGVGSREYLRRWNDNSSYRRPAPAVCRRHAPTCACASAGPSGAAAAR